VHNGDYAKRPKIHKTIRDRAAVESTLAGETEVASWAPRVYSPALAYGINKTSPAQIFGVDPTLEPTVTRILQKVSAGTFFDAFPDQDGYFKAMIGAGLARTLKLGVGDEIVIIASGADGSIANDIFIITGIVGNVTSFDRQGVYLPLTVAQEFLSVGADVHEYALLAKNKNRNEDLSVQLQAQIPSLKVSPWQELRATFYKTMQSDKEGNMFTVALVVFIVFIGVLNTVLMSVLERTREFGVLKSIGSRPADLVRLIFLETIMLTGMSVFVGFLLIFPVIYWFAEVGMSMGVAIEIGGVEFDTMTGEISSYVLFVPMAFILSTAALISIPPGLRAAKIMPRLALGSH
jgi:ABC-type lipoprotein release transport system permease subunit